jgi:hypothetical protein
MRINKSRILISTAMGENEKSKRKLQDVSEAKLRSDLNVKTVTCPACLGVTTTDCAFCGNVREVSAAKAKRYKDGGKN